MLLCDPVISTPPLILLQIFEKLNKRPSYSVYLKYSRTGTSNVQILAPPRSTLEHAKAIFRKFFVQETGKKWEDRLSNQAPPPKRDVNGKDLPLHEGWYSIEFKKSTILGTYMAEPAQKLVPAESQSVIPGQSNIAFEPTNGINMLETAEVDTLQTTDKHYFAIHAGNSRDFQQFDGPYLFEH